MDWFLFMTRRDRISGPAGSVYFAAGKGMSRHQPTGPGACRRSRRKHIRAVPSSPSGEMSRSDKRGWSTGIPTRTGDPLLPKQIIIVISYFSQLIKCYTN